MATKNTENSKRYGALPLATFVTFVARGIDMVVEGW